jgi:hypothetical protein
MPGAVFAPFHYGAWDPDDVAVDGHRRQANELTMTIWDPVSKQPLFKTAACRVTKVDNGASSDREPPGPTSDARGQEANGGSPTSSQVLSQTPRYPNDPALGTAENRPSH